MTLTKLFLLAKELFRIIYFGCLAVFLSVIYDACYEYLHINYESLTVQAQELMDFLYYITPVGETIILLILLFPLFRIFNRIY